MKYLLSLIASLGLGFGAHAGTTEAEEKRSSKTELKVNQALSGKTATSYLRTENVRDAKDSKLVINQALSGKTAVVYVRTPEMAN